MNAVNASNDKRHADAARRKEFILGTNQFPNFTEKSDGKQPLSPVCCCSTATTETELPALNKARLASEFETLRLATEKAEKQPIAFMLTIGNLAMRQARAQFSCNFLAAAGYKVMDNLGFKTVEEGVDAALEAKADIVVICSSDDEYAEYAIPAFKYLDGRAMYVVAGAPACSDDFSRRMASSGRKRMASALTGGLLSRLTFSPFIPKKTSKAWSTSTSRQVFLPTSVARTP